MPPQSEGPKMGIVGKTETGGGRLQGLGTQRSFSAGDRQASCFLRILLLMLVALGPSSLGPSSPAHGRDPGTTTRLGVVTGLPLPRFATLKADRVNVRRGPGQEHAIAWVFQRVGLPIEIIGEVEAWRQVRDSEGAEGWIFAGLLSGRRSAIVEPWNSAAPAPAPSTLSDLIQATAAAPDPTVLDKSALVTIHFDRGGDILAYLEPGTIVAAQACDGQWCRVSIRRIEGYVEQKKLWGVYPNERFD